MATPDPFADLPSIRSPDPFGDLPPIGVSQDASALQEFDAFASSPAGVVSGSTVPPDPFSDLEPVPASDAFADLPSIPKSEAGWGEMLASKSKTIPSQLKASFGASVSRVGQDDIVLASTIEKSFEDLPPEEDDSLWANFKRITSIFNLSNLMSAQRAVIKYSSPEATKAVGKLDRELTKVGDRIYRNAQREIEKNYPALEKGSAKYYTSLGLDALGLLVPAFAATVATRSPAVGGAVMGSEMFGTYYQEEVDEGRSPGEANTIAVARTIFDAVPEYVALGVLTKPGGKYLKEILKGTAAEGLQEGITEMLNIGYDIGALNENMTWGEAWERIRDAFIVGGFAGGAIRSVAHPFIKEPEGGEEDATTERPVQRGDWKEYREDETRRVPTETGGGDRAEQGREVEETVIPEDVAYGRQAEKPINKFDPDNSFAKQVGTGSIIRDDKGVDRTVRETHTIDDKEYAVYYDDEGKEVRVPIERADLQPVEGDYVANKRGTVYKVIGTADFDTVNVVNEFGTETKINREDLTVLDFPKVPEKTEEELAAEAEAAAEQERIDSHLDELKPGDIVKNKRGTEFEVVDATDTTQLIVKNDQGTEQIMNRKDAETVRYAVAKEDFDIKAQDTVTDSKGRKFTVVDVTEDGKLVVRNSQGTEMVVEKDAMTLYESYSPEQKFYVRDEVADADFEVYTVVETDGNTILVRDKHGKEHVFDEEELTLREPRKIKVGDYVRDVRGDQFQVIEKRPDKKQLVLRSSRGRVTVVKDTSVAPEPFVTGKVVMDKKGRTLRIISAKDERRLLVETPDNRQIHVFRSAVDPFEPTEALKRQGIDRQKVTTNLDADKRGQYVDMIVDVPVKVNAPIRDDGTQFQQPLFAQALRKMKTVEDILDWIYGKSSNQFYRKIARRIREVSGNVPVQIVSPYTVVEGKVPSTIDSARGMYVRAPTKEKIYLVDEGYSHHGMTERTALHEAIHAATAHAISKGISDIKKGVDSIYSRAVKDLNDLRAHVAKNLLADIEAGTLQPYEEMAGLIATDNIHEMITWGFTDMDFQNYLKNMPYKGATTWSKFVDAVRRLLGLEPSQGNALGELIEVFDRVALAQVEIRKLREQRAKKKEAKKGIFVNDAALDQKEINAKERLRNKLIYSHKPDLEGFPGYVKPVGEVSENLDTSAKREKYKFSNPAVDAAVQKQKGGLEVTKTWKDKITSVWNVLGKGFSRKYRSMPHTERWSNTLFTLRKFEDAPVTGKQDAELYLTKFTKGMSQVQFDDFANFIWLNDQMVELMADRPIVANMTAQELIDAHTDITARVNADQLVKEATEHRLEVINLVGKRLVEVGILTQEQIDKNPVYFRHQVLEHAMLNQYVGSRGNVRKPRAAYGKRRTGDADINLNYLEAEYLYLSEVFTDIRRQEALTELDSLENIYDQHVANIRSDNIDRLVASQPKPNVIDELNYRLEKGQTVGLDRFLEKHLKENYLDPDKNLPEGYSLTQIDKGKVFFSATTISEKAVGILNELAATEVSKLGFSKADIEAVKNSMNEVIAMGKDKPKMLIPDELLGAIEEINQIKPHNGITWGLRKSVSAWKVWILFSPTRVMTYFHNNFSGDLDAILNAPGILKYMYGATVDLFNLYYRGKPPAADILDARDRSVFTGSITAQEIPDINHLDAFAKFAAKKDGVFQKFSSAMVAPFKKWFSSMKKLNEFRESIVRLAAYRYALDFQAKGEKVYWATLPEMADKHTGKDRAALVSRELIGDYGNMSANGREIRDSYIPFFSWMETNFKRYLKLINNAFELGVMKGAKQSGLVGAALGTRVTVWLGFKAFMMYAAIQLWNEAFYGDEEDELSEMAKSRLHIITGRDDKGNVTYISFPGAMGDFLATIGWPEVSAMAEGVERGKYTYTDVLKEMGKQTVNRIAAGLNPAIKVPFEVGLGVRFFPDIFSPQRAPDADKQVLSILALDKAYDLITEHPDKGAADFLKSMAVPMFRSADPKETAYYKTKALVADFNKATRGIEGFSTIQTPKSKVVYLYKKSLKYKDKEAIKYFEEKLDEFDISNSEMNKILERSHPLAGLRKKDRKEFFDGLTEKEMELVDIAEDYFDEVFFP